MNIEKSPKPKIWSASLTTVASLEAQDTSYGLHFMSQYLTQVWNVPLSFQQV